MSAETPPTASVPVHGVPVCSVGVHKARAVLPQLVRDAEAGRAVEFTRGDECAWLISPDLAARAGWDLAAAPDHGIADARKVLGDLVTRAAAGIPQLLRRHKRVVAALVPATAVTTITTALSGPAFDHESAGPVPTTTLSTKFPAPAFVAGLGSTAAAAVGGTAPDPAPAAASASAPEPEGAAPASRSVRRLAPLGQALAAVLPAPATSAPDGPGPLPGLSTGIAVLDRALGGLQAGRFYLVAGAPGAGGSLLAASAARTTALTHHRTVLYAASGLTRHDVAARVTAAHTPVDYRRLRAGALTGDERQAVAATVRLLDAAPLFIDDGTDLDAEAIITTAADVPDLALLVVDRLQAAGDPRLPLSGRQAIADAVQALAHLAHTRHLPVLAALDTDDPALLNTLATDVTLTLTRDAEYAQVVVAERDFGPVATVQLHAELPHARFTDAPTSPPTGPAPAATPADPAQPTEPLGCALGPGTPLTDTIAHPSTATAVPTAPALDAAQAELLNAAVPYLSGASTGLSARVTSTLAALRDAATAGTTALPGLRAATVDLAARGLRLPDTTEGHRLAAALQAFATTTTQAAATPAQAARQAAGVQRRAVPPDVATTGRVAQALPTAGATTEQPVKTPAPPTTPPTTAAPTPARPSRRNTAERPDLVSFIPDRVAAALEMHGGDADAALLYLAGVPNKAGQAIEDVMELWDATRVGGRYGHTAYPDLPDPLIRKRKGNADEVWEARPKFTNPGKELRGQAVTPLDVNGAYLSALGAAALPVRSLTHNPNGTDAKGRAWSWENPGDYGRGANLAGIVRIDQPAWPHAHLPHPLGDDRETAGRLWIPTSVFAKLKDARNAGLLEELPRIREAYVAPGTDNLFTILVNILRDARAKAIADGDTLTKTYVAKMYAVLVSTIGDSGANHHLKRPDWEHIIRGHAFANLWRKAVRAHRAGLTVAYAGGTDELHLVGSPGDVFGARLDGKPVFRQGTGLAEIKTKGEPYAWSGKAVRH